MGHIDKKTATDALYCVVGVALLALAFLCTSCNVTRICTTESQYLQRGDTSIVIMTKTIETYDASKKQQ